MAALHSDCNTSIKSSTVAAKELRYYHLQNYEQNEKYKRKNH